MLTTPKRNQYTHPPLIADEEKKLRPFHAYREFLAKTAGTFAVISIVVLACLIVAYNLPWKLSTPRRDSFQHLSVGDSSFNDHFDKFRQFMRKYDKEYKTYAEMEERFANFRKTLIKIEELNHLEKLTTTEFGINGFADMSDEEFQKILMPVKQRESPRNASFIQAIPDHVRGKLDTAYPYPAHFDWRDKAYIY